MCDDYKNKEEDYKECPGLNQCGNPAFPGPWGSYTGPYACEQFFCQTCDWKGATCESVRNSLPDAGITAPDGSTPPGQNDLPLGDNPPLTSDDGSTVDDAPPDTTAHAPPVRTEGEFYSDDHGEGYFVPRGGGVECFCNEMKCGQKGGHCVKWTCTSGTICDLT